MKVSVYIKNCYILRLFSLQYNEFYLILQLTSGTVQRIVEYCECRTKDTGKTAARNV